MFLLAATIDANGDISGMPSMQPTEQSCTSPPGSTGSEHTPVYPSCVRLLESPLSLEQWRLALSKLKKILLRLHSWGQLSDWLLLDWAVSYYCTDQLLTPYFSGASTQNGTPSGDRWARVIGGQIGWQSEPLHRFDTNCSGSTDLKMQTHGKHDTIPPHRKHTTKPTSAQRPRPPRDGARKNTCHALVHTRPLPWIPGL